MRERQRASYAQGYPKAGKPRVDEVLCRTARAGARRKRRRPSERAPQADIGAGGWTRSLDHVDTIWATRPSLSVLPSLYIFTSLSPFAINLSMRPHSTAAWSSLPVEIKLSVVDLLTLDDIKSFSAVDSETYSLCEPSMFRVSPLPYPVPLQYRWTQTQSVNISSYEALQAYMSSVPKSYYSYIRQLHICTKANKTITGYRRPVTDAVLELLENCTQVEKLTLNLEGSLSKSVIPCFAKLHSLTNLCINHCGDEQRTPM